VRYLQLHSANLTPWHTSHNTICAWKLDADPMLLGALNGTIELATCTFREGRREDYITKQCAVAFDPTAQCPNWIEFQEKIAHGDADLVA
jgi:putative DNA primase/helicase